MGLISFDGAMSAALLLYLLPTGYQIPPPARWRKLKLIHAVGVKLAMRPTAQERGPEPVLSPQVMKQLSSGSEA
jgi:hypothetical protein